MKNIMKSSGHPLTMARQDNKSLGQPGNTTRTVVNRSQHWDKSLG